MTINSELSNLASGFRKLYGNYDRYSIDDMTRAISGLSIKNYLDPGQSSSVLNYKNLTGITEAIWNQNFLGKTITISFDVTWSNYKGGRLGIEYAYIDKDNQPHYYGSWYTPITPSGSIHVFTDLAIDSSGINTNGFTEKGMYIQANDDIVAKITNPKIVINPVGVGSNPS